MGTTFCPECRQPMADTVYGVRLPIFKARLFRHIESHPGQPAQELAWTFEKKPVTIQVHIHQINDLMMNTDIKIVGDKLLGYRVQKVEHV